MDWLLYGAVRKEALLTSQIEGTQATLVDLFNQEAGFMVSNTDEVAEVSNYLRAFRFVQEQLHNPKGLPISTRLLCDAHRLLLDGVRGAGKQPGEIRHSQKKGWPLPQPRPSTTLLPLPGLFPNPPPPSFFEEAFSFFIFLSVIFCHYYVWEGFEWLR